MNFAAISPSGMTRFLIPGENFHDSIAAALEQSSLFALAVTPNLVNEPNYVMSIEYPMAKEAKKRCFPLSWFPRTKKIWKKNSRSSLPAPM